MKRKILAGTVILTCLIMAVLLVGETGPRRVLANDGKDSLEVRFWFDSAEKYDDNLEGFIIEDTFVADRTSDVWDVRGYFFSFERDSFHKGDIEGVWILKNRRTGAIITTPPAHKYVQVRSELAYTSEGKLKTLDFFIEGNTHGTRWEAATYWELGFVPHGADGKKDMRGNKWFEEKKCPVYKGREGTKLLQEKYSWLPKDAKPRKLRLTPITKAMTDGGKIYNRLLDAALEVNERVKIKDLLKEEPDGEQVGEKVVSEEKPGGTDSPSAQKPSPWGKLPEERDNALSEVNTKNINSESGVNPRLTPAAAKDFNKIAKEFHKQAGKKTITITSMFRTFEKQRRLHRDSPSLANKQGTSWHEAGLAFDILLGDLSKEEYKKLLKICQDEKGWVFKPARIKPDNMSFDEWWKKVSKGEIKEAWHLTYQRAGARIGEAISRLYKQRQLEKGMEGPDVKQYQEMLAAEGFYPKEKIDGLYGDDTENARIEYEKEHGGIDLTAIQLRYISAQSEPWLEANTFSYIVEAQKVKGGSKITKLADASQRLIDFLLIGLILPNDKFWVNLNPWEPERIVDEDVGTTDVGRIMLEADLQMKGDFCKYENPGETDVGAKYWEQLDKKQEELVNKCMSDHPGQIEDTDNVLFQAATRHWIVPDEITAYGNGDEIYIAEATLSIYSEPVYEHSTFEIVNQSKSLLSAECLKSLEQAVKEYGRYAKELEEELILPFVVEEVNNGDQYSALRQVYLSLALAQWYKERFEDTSMFSDLMDSANLTGLESEETWSPRDIWEDYVKSYEKGEYHYEKEISYTKGNLIITETRVYSGGGVDFADTVSRTSVAGDIHPYTEELLIEAIYTPFLNEGNNYYFGDYLYVPTPAPAPGTQNWIKVALALVILGIIIGCFTWFHRKRITIRRPKIRTKVPRKL